MSELARISEVTGFYAPRENSEEFSELVRHPAHKRRVTRQFLDISEL
jgi:hypothetical protein